MHMIRARASPLLPPDTPPSIIGISGLRMSLFSTVASSVYTQFDHTFYSTTIVFIFISCTAVQVPRAAALRLTRGVRGSVAGKHFRNAAVVASRGDSPCPRWYVAWRYILHRPPNRAPKCARARGVVLRQVWPKTTRMYIPCFFELFKKNGLCAGKLDLWDRSL